MVAAVGCIIFFSVELKFNGMSRLLPVSFTLLLRPFLSLLVTWSGGSYIALCSSSSGASDVEKKR